MKGSVKYPRPINNRSYVLVAYSRNNEHKLYQERSGDRGHLHGHK